jgi:hypothetical protein
VETGDCLLEQEGHSRAVYAVAFQAGMGAGEGVAEGQMRGARPNLLL